MYFVCLIFPYLCIFSSKLSLSSECRFKILFLHTFFFIWALNYFITAQSFIKIATMPFNVDKDRDIIFTTQTFFIQHRRPHKSKSINNEFGYFVFINIQSSSFKEWMWSEILFPQLWRKPGKVISILYTDTATREWIAASSYVKSFSAKCMKVFLRVNIRQKLYIKRHTLTYLDTWMSTNVRASAACCHLYCICRCKIYVAPLCHTSTCVSVRTAMTPLDDYFSVLASSIGGPSNSLLFKAFL
jgi:hypothetical protein